MGNRGPKPKRKPVGAPTKLTGEVIALLTQALRTGAYVETAVAHVGIHKDSYYRWIRKGRDERLRIDTGGKPRKSFGLFLELYDAVEKAQAAAEVRDLAIISKAAENHWQAAAWKLERRNPGRWGRTRHEITGADGGPLAVANWSELIAAAADDDETG